jgi:hypothetical protein
VFALADVLKIAQRFSAGNKVNEETEPALAGDRKAPKARDAIAWANGPGNPNLKIHQAATRRDKSNATISTIAIISLLQSSGH